MVCEPARGAGRASDRRLTVERAEQRVYQFRLLDDHVGGETFAPLTSEVAAMADLLRLARHAEDIGRRLLFAPGELCQWLPSRIDSSTGRGVDRPTEDVAAGQAPDGPAGPM